jgi:hypothetical protein
MPDRRPSVEELLVVFCQTILWIVYHSDGAMLQRFIARHQKEDVYDRPDIGY